MACILCVTDDRGVVEQLRPTFAPETDNLLIARTAAALRVAHERRPGLVILDLDAPAVDGQRLLRMLHERAPVIALSAAVDVDDEGAIALLAAGADECVRKPFNPRLLVARAQALLRRVELVARDGRRPDERASYRIADAVFEPSSHRIVRGDGAIDLTPIQSRILHLLCAHEGQPVSTERIATHLWGGDAGGTDAAYTKGTIRTHMRYLREKIERVPADPQMIRTVQGIGYKIQDTG